jgi:cell division transport system permease protein
VILRRPRHLLREAGRNLWSFKGRHAISLAIICLSFVVLGVFLCLSNNLRERARAMAQNLAVVFYFDGNVPEAERLPVEEEIRRSPLVGSVRAVPPDEASARFLRDFPELKDIVLNLGMNPFPASLEVSFKDPATPAETILAFIDGIKRSPAVRDVQFNREWADKISSLGRLAAAVGLFFGGILVLAAFFIISNVIKLIVIARRSEIEILRLVGATDTFIRLPFLLEGTILGAAGGLLALGLVFLLVRLFPAAVGPSLGALRELIGFRFLTLGQSLALVGGGGFIGFLGSLSSLSRFLRI